MILKSDQFDINKAGHMAAENTEERLEEKVDAFIDACRNHGLKLTQQRLEIFKELARSKKHPSAETLFRRLRKRMPSLSLDTVYRTLTTFEQHGVIVRAPVWDGCNRFDANMAQHHHLVCTECSKIQDFYWPSFDRSQLPDEVEGWGKPVRKHVEIKAVCNECLKKMETG